MNVWWDPQTKFQTASRILIKFGIAGLHWRYRTNLSLIRFMIPTSHAVQIEDITLRVITITLKTF